MNWHKIIKRLFHWHGVDQRHVDALKVYCSTIAPQEHSPILDGHCVDGFLDGVCQDDKELKDWFLYYLYEAPHMKGDATVIDGDEEYNFKNKKEFVRFLEDNYGKK